MELADLIHHHPHGSWVSGDGPRGGVMDDGFVSFGPTPPLASLLTLDPLPTVLSPPLSGGEAILGYFDRIFGSFHCFCRAVLMFCWSAHHAIVLMFGSAGNRRERDSSMYWTRSVVLSDFAVFDGYHHPRCVLVVYWK